MGRSGEFVGQSGGFAGGIRAAHEGPLRAPLGYSWDFAGEFAGKLGYLWDNPGNSWANQGDSWETSGPKVERGSRVSMFTSEGRF